jgi:predicted acylesterase/phospholipase RssA
MEKCEAGTQTEVEDFHSSVEVKPVYNRACIVKEPKIIIDKPKKLVLSGGGIRGVGLLGGLSFLHSQNYLSDVKEFYGTSIGGIISVLLIVGYSPFEIFHEAYTTQLAIKRKVGYMQLSSLVQAYGLYDSIDFLQPIYNLIVKKVGSMPTLRELFEKYNKELYITTYNTTKQTPVYLSRHSHPDLGVDIALKMTSSIPLLFAMCTHEDQSYIDGGIADNYPLDFAMSNHDEDVPIGEEFTLGLNLSSQPLNNNSIISYLQNLISIPSRLLEKERLDRYENHPWCRTVVICVDNCSVIDFEESKQKWFEMYDQGYNQMVRQVCEVDE